MPLQMVDGDQRLSGCHGDGLGRHQPDDDPADEAGACGGGHCVDVIEADAGFRHGFGHDPVQHGDMGAGGDFRHHAAEFGVLVNLRADDVGEDFRRLRPAHNGGGGFVAAGFDAKNCQHGVLPAVAAAVVSRALPVSQKVLRCPNPARPV